MPENSFAVTLRRWTALETIDPVASVVMIDGD
jgi:hypothetical protein